MESTTLPNDAITKEAADAVVEFALIAFEPEHFFGDADSIAALTEFVWNSCDPGAEVLASACFLPDRPTRMLFRRLKKARHARFGQHHFTLWGLELRVEGRQAVLAFELSWDGGATCRPFRTTLDRSQLPPAVLAESA